MKWGAALCFKTHTHTHVAHGTHGTHGTKETFRRLKQQAFDVWRIFAIFTNVFTNTQSGGNLCCLANPWQRWYYLNTNVNVQRACSASVVVCRQHLALALALATRLCRIQASSTSYTTCSYSTT